MATRSKQEQRSTFLKDPVQTETNHHMARNAFKFSQDTMSVGTFNPNGDRTDDNAFEITTNNGEDPGDMSKITRTVTDAFTSMSATDITETYQNIKRMMIGLERLIQNKGLRTCNNGDPTVRSQLPSTVPPLSSGVMGLP